VITSVERASLIPSSPTREKAEDILRFDLESENKKQSRQYLRRIKTVGRSQ